MLDDDNWFSGAATGYDVNINNSNNSSSSNSNSNSNSYGNGDGDNEEEEDNDDDDDDDDGKDINTSAGARPGRGASTQRGTRFVELDAGGLEADSEAKELQKRLLQCLET